MKIPARMASPILTSGMPTKTARCTAMTTTRHILMDTDILMTMTTATPKVIHTTTPMGMIMAIHTTHNTL